MAFSVLVGLALDYDIFLMARVVEFRKLGWSDRAAICLAVEKTGNIITAAGLIMSISFAGLLIPQTVVLNQYGFILFIGVAIDTFNNAVAGANVSLAGADGGTNHVDLIFGTGVGGGVISSSAAISRAVSKSASWMRTVTIAVMRSTQSSKWFSRRSSAGRRRSRGRRRSWCPA